MPDKLTDKEIVNCFEWVKNCNAGLVVDCIGCPLQEHYPLCEEALIDISFHEINRLQEKDETRHKVFETKCEELEIAKAENERLQTEIKLLTENGVTAKYPYCAFLDTGIFLSKEPNGYEKWNAYVRNQAYKEFAERLKKEKHICLPPIGYPIDENDWVIYENDIDDLLKEMVGEDK